MRGRGHGESDTSNNCFLGWFEVPVPLPRPDVVVQSPSVDDGTPGDRSDVLSVSNCVQLRDWQSAPTTLRYYRSTDATITAADTEVGTDEVTGLLYPPLGGQWIQSSESIDLTAPSTAGTYYYGACVDSVTGESDTTNNCSSSVTVVVALSVSGITTTNYAENGTARATYAVTGAAQGSTIHGHYPGTTAATSR